jgi:hypothetical protein
VYWKYGQFAAWKLRDMTHKETPWATAQTNGAISRESMATFFDKRFFVDPKDIPPLIPEERVEIGKAFEELEVNGEFSISELC